MKKYVAELIGTFVLDFAIISSILAMRNMSRPQQRRRSARTVVCRTKPSPGTSTMRPVR